MSKPMTAPDALEVLRRFAYVSHEASIEEAKESAGEDQVGFTCDMCWCGYGTSSAKSELCDAYGVLHQEIRTR